MTDHPELIDTGPRPAVHLERTYDHPIERVWRAVTEPEHLAHWFPTEASIELRPGGKIRFGDLGDGGSEGEVLAVEPPHRLDFTWGDQRFEFRLEPVAAGTRFTLVHHFDDRAGAASFAAGWETCMGALAAVLAGEPPPPPTRAVRRHEELVRRFGLDRPRVTRGPAGWRVRFERQLTCPEDRARDLVAGLGPEARVHLVPGTGHGARLVLEVEGADGSEIDAAVERWHAAVERIAREAAG